MRYNHLLVFLFFYSFLLFAPIIYAGCQSVCYSDGWCSQECSDGAYPTNDGCHQGSAECGGGSEVSGGWVDGGGVGQDGAYGPNGSAVTKDKTWDMAEVGGGLVGSALNCSTKPYCSNQQMKDATNAYKNGAFGYKVGSLVDILANPEANRIDPQLLQDIKDGKILVATWTNDGDPSKSPFSNSFPIGWTSFIYIPAWTSIPPAIQLAQTGEYYAPPGVTYESCRICENGNFKSEEVLTGSCKGTELTYCTDYHLNPEVDPIVQYRFPLCHLFPVPPGGTTPTTGNLATFARPVSIPNLTYSLKDITGVRSCKVEYVDSSGIPTTAPSPTDLQVVTCDVTISRVANQDIQIQTSGVSFPYQGLYAPIWATRDTADLSTCANPGTDTKTMTPYGQHLMVIALPFSSPWIKVADGTYARSAITGTSSLPLTNYLPGFTAPFNSADVDTEASIPYFLSGTGAGTVVGTVQVGSVAAVSATNWKADAYTSTNSNSPTTLYKQLIQKKVYKEYPAASPPPAALVLSDEITIINDATEAGYTLSSLAFSPTDAKTSYTLIIKNGSSLGNLTIDTASLNPSGSPALLIIASKITLKDPAATTIGAVIVADSLDTGSGDALHIIGNLSLTNPLHHRRARTDSDDRKPTIFVQYSIDSYLSLLPTLGSSSREWTQIE